MKEKLVISEILRTAWGALKSEFWLLVGLNIGYTLISMTLGLFSPNFKESISVTNIIVMLVSLFVSAIFTLGYTKNMFQTLDKVEPQFSSYGRESRKCFNYIGASILCIIIVLVGFVFLIIPGFYLMLRFLFFQYAIVEENAGIIDSLKRSWEITKGHSLFLFLLLLTATGLYIVGFLALGIGIFVVTPFVGLMFCFVFRKLTLPAN